MEKMERWATLVALSDVMRDRGSWCGETHLQKSAYLLQELTGVDLGYEFVLYKHGPFSFDLRDELGVMRARAVIDRKVQPSPYGPTLLPTESGRRSVEKYGEFLEKVRDDIEYVAEALGDKGVAQLERITTAFFVTSEEDMKGASPEERADRLVAVKPHVSREEAQEAVEFVDQMRDNLPD